LRSATSGAGSYGLAPESKYLNFISLGLRNADLAGLDADLIIPASSVSSAFGRGCAGLDADLMIPASSVSSAFERGCAGLDADLMIPASSVSSAFGL